jgi:regulator of protease activity HflC (stomatin/prohibitin superfamily)
MFNLKKTLKLIVMVIIIAIPFLLTGCNSKVVPPGTVVIVLQADGDGNIHTKGSYTTWGRDRVYFVDTKLKSFTEKMEILCKDNINKTVEVKWIGSFDVAKDKVNIIKEKVPADKISTGDLEGYQLSFDKFYATAMKDIIRANSREQVSPYITDNIREERTTIQAAIKKAIVERFTKLGYPIKTTEIMISNLDYPDEVTTQRKAIKNAQLEDEKQAALAKAAIAQAKRAASIARENGMAQIEKAKADAISNDIRSKSLTPQIIAMRQWDVLQTLGQPICDEDGKNCVQSQLDMIFVPYNSTGKDEIQTALLRQMKVEK